MSIYHSLSEEDQQLAVTEGRTRTDDCIAVGTGGRNKQLDHSRSQLAIQTEGVIGEIAVARAFGLEFIPSYRGRRWTNSYDLLDKNGNRIDVKATNKPRGRLMLYKPKPTDKNQYQNIDLFVSTRVHRYPPLVEIVGWAWKADLMRDENLEDWGYGPTYFLNEHDPRFHKIT